MNDTEDTEDTEPTETNALPLRSFDHSAFERERDDEPAPRKTSEGLQPEPQHQFNPRYDEFGNPAFGVSTDCFPRGRR
jgi:hypothetical protein